MANITSAIIILLLIFVVETRFPYRKDFGPRFQHIRRNGFFAVFNQLLVTILFVLVTGKVFSWVERENIGILNQIDSVIVKGFLAFLLFDLWMYSWHRANHRIYFLWLFHRMHHNDPNLDFTTAMRFHPIEILLSVFFNLFVILFLGLTLKDFLFYQSILFGNILFHHSNIALPEKVDRQMRKLIVTPNMHRVHHSVVRKETDSNYASIFSFWDRFFKSFRERETKTIKYGINRFMEDENQSVKGLLKLPFQK